MMNKQHLWLQALNQTALTALVRQVLHNDTALVTTWAYQPLSGGAGLLAHLYRVAGNAELVDQIVPWSLILKVSQASQGSRDPASVWYWKREALVYQSGFLAQL